MVRCRACRAMRWRGDPCPNAECPRLSRQTTPLRAKTRPITVNVAHGFHAPVTETRFASDYDLPIKARRWTSAR